MWKGKAALWNQALSFFLSYNLVLFFSVGKIHLFLFPHLIWSNKNPSFRYACLEHQWLLDFSAHKSISNPCWAVISNDVTKTLVVSYALGCFLPIRSPCLNCHSSTIKNNANCFPRSTECRVINSLQKSLSSFVVFWILNVNLHIKS